MSKKENTTKALSKLVEELERRGIFRSCYLTGSYANGYAVPEASDIDVTIVSSSAMGRAENAWLDDIIHQIDGAFSVSLDVSLINSVSSGEKTGSKLSFLGIAFREAALSAKLAGHLIWGEDVLAQIPMPSTEEYIAQTEKIPFEFSNRVRGYKGLVFPLSYPDPEDHFLGYVNKNDQGEPSTKQLISLLTWIGTATVARLNGEKVGNKKQCVDALTRANPVQGQELSEIFDLCRGAWRYRLPTSHNSQDKLKIICEKALSWENRYREKFFPELTELKQ